MNEVGCEGWGAVLWRAGDEGCAVPWFAGPAVRTVRGSGRRRRAGLWGVRVLRRAGVRCAAGRGLAARGDAVCCGARGCGVLRGAGWRRAEDARLARGAGWRGAEDARLPRAALDIRRRAARRAAFLIYKLPPKAASL